MRIAQISDFHFTRLTCNPLRLFSKRFLGHFNWLISRRLKFSEAPGDEIPALLKKLKVDLILLGGDFTTTALEEEFKVAQKFVKSLPAPWIALPGNHDVYTYRSHRQKHFYRFFKNKREEIKHPVDFFSLSDHQIEAHRLKENYWLIAIDVCRATNPYSSRGLFSKKLEERMKEILSMIPTNDSILVLCHYPFFQNDSHRHTLKREDKLQAILKNDPRIRIFLHGHTHRQIIADLQPSGLPLILDSGSLSLLDRASWNLIDLVPSGCTVTPYQWNGEWKPTHAEGFEWKR